MGSSSNAFRDRRNIQAFAFPVLQTAEDVFFPVDVQDRHPISPDPKQAFIERASRQEADRLEP